MENSTNLISNELHNCLNFQSFIKNSLQPFFLTNLTGKILDINDAFLDLTGYVRDDIIGQEIYDIYFKEPDQKEINKIIEQQASVKNKEVEIKTKNGEILITIHSLVHYKNSEGQIIGYQGFLKDISDQKRMEQKLYELLETYKKTFNRFGIGLAIVEEDTTVSMVNMQFLRMSGYTKEQVIGTSWTKYVPKKEMERLFEYHKQRRETPNFSPQTYEAKLLYQNSEERYYALNVSLIPGTHKSLIAIIDINYFKQIEQTLRERNKNYQTLINTFPDGLLQLNTDLTIRMANQTFLVQLGNSIEEEVKGKNILEFIQTEDHNKLIEARQTAMEKGTFHYLELRIITKDDKIVPFEISMSTLYDHFGNPSSLIFVLRNIEKRKERESKLWEHAKDLEKKVEEKALRLIEQERAALLGRLAGSISHNINNPLQYVRGNAELLQKMINDDKTSKKVLNEMIQTLIDGCDRITDVSERLRNVSSKGQVSIFEIANCIETAITVTRGKWKTKCSMIKVRHLTNDIIKVKGIENDIAHVLMNLIVNSVQAIEKNGEIEIQIESINEDSEVLITVEDNGKGIPDEIAKKIGKESVTTKSLEQGTGLGLLWVYDVIKQHYGSIDFESKVGEGTIFRVKLPRYKAENNKP